MRIPESVIRFVHRHTCGTKPLRLPEDGCCGCDAAIADVYLTVGCDYCKAPGETYCRACAENTDWVPGITLADFTAFPGREWSAT